MITLEQLKLLLPTNPEYSKWLEPLNKILPKYEINTQNRLAMFFGQVCHESGEFKFLKENLNYGENALLKVFKKYFTPLTAKIYSRNSEKIANRVYSNRMGNSDEKSGDGWKYRGRGLIQLTGKDNYSKFAESIGKSLEETVMHLETLEGALESACWYWQKNNLNMLADTGDIVGVTKKINGGLNGIEERRKRYENAFKILK
jgi:putative chitinase